MTIGTAIEEATMALEESGVDSPRLDAQLLLAWWLNCRREDLAREPEFELSTEDIAAYESAIVRRCARVPLPYITGVQAFRGHLYQVSEAVLIPRPETELLVSQTLKSLEGHVMPRIIDVGTGSGCIAIALACERRDANVWATDISVEALIVARANCTRLNAGITFLQGDMLNDNVAARLTPGLPFDAVVCNPPYVAAWELADLQPEVQYYEPRIALSGLDAATGNDGTALYPRLIEQAYRALSPGGWLLLEVGYGQAAAISSIADQAGYREVSVHRDLGDIPRVVAARK